MADFSATHRFRDSLWSKLRQLQAGIEPISDSRESFGLQENAPACPPQFANDDELRKYEEYERLFATWSEEYGRVLSEHTKQVAAGWGPTWEADLKELLRLAVHEIARAGLAQYISVLEGLYDGFLATFRDADRGNCDLFAEIDYSNFHCAELEFDKIAYLFDGEAKPVPRLQFDEQTLVVTLDGKPIAVNDPTTFLIFREIHSAGPRRISAAEIRKRIERHIDDNTIYRHIRRKLPKELSKIVHGNNQGRTIVWP